MKTKKDYGNWLKIYTMGLVVCTLGFSICGLSLISNSIEPLFIVFCMFQTLAILSNIMILTIIVNLNYSFPNLNHSGKFKP